MNISGLKPWRDYSEHDVLNIFASPVALQKGTLVAISGAIGNTNVMQNTGTPPATPYQTVSTTFGNAPAYAYGVKGQVVATIKAAGSGDPCIGMTLYEVRDTNSFGEQFRYRPAVERIEQQVSLIGESVPIAKRGTFTVDNISGTATAGSGFTAVVGRFLPQVYSKSTSLGMFLTNEDADGYAVIALDCV